MIVPAVERDSQAAGGQRPEWRRRPLISFSRSSGIHGALSNFAVAPFELDGRQWPTVEHYFQAAKFFGTLGTPACTKNN